MLTPNHSNENFPLTEKEKSATIQRVALAYTKVLDELHIDWRNDPNSKDTAMRVAKSMVNEVFAGRFCKPPKITAFENVEGYSGVVFQGNIDIYSTCSHHHLPFTGKCHIGYIPSEKGKVIGLSKLNRIADFMARRPQVQENLTNQIHQMVSEVCEGNLGVAVMIQANHSCVSCRGIGHQSTMITAKLSGAFQDEDSCRNEFYQFVNLAK